MSNKKETIRLWLDAYPSLHNYSNTKLYSILGPFVIGIELIKLPRVDNYRPHFVLYPLYCNNLKTCLSYPIFLLEFFNKKGLEYSIPYNMDDKSLFNDVKNSINNKISKEVGKDMPISTIFKLIDEQIGSHITKLQLKQPEFYEVKYYSALYVSNDKANTVLEEIQKEHKSWDMNKFNTYYGDYNEWYDSLKGKDRNSFLKLINKNKSDEKLGKLNQSELV
ncbi:conserved hypothetical protein [Tenacibaculum maritimum]|uniref:hypothetical protein n=1 Tax=Tenacibaculum maritimum TaxID=107401 RepID=UPI0012E49FD4|nr:hypothetical protein [Tenacibaculum maritimum]CAA0211195.1 conserved hypothetical protein [Tenacibaculum maritimum]CAA0227164.1 conserved hypothetical protein [Tenacibaculum maritimum]